MVSSLEAMAGVAATQGRAVVAAGLFGAAEATRAASGSVLTAVEIADYHADVTVLRASPEPADLDVAWAQGVAISIDDAAALALRGTGPRDRSRILARVGVPSRREPPDAR